MPDPRNNKMKILAAAARRQANPAHARPPVARAARPSGAASAPSGERPAGRDATRAARLRPPAKPSAKRAQRESSHLTHSCDLDGHTVAGVAAPLVRRERALVREARAEGAVDERAVRPSEDARLAIERLADHRPDPFAVV